MSIELSPGQAAYVNGQIALMNCRMQGMIAENAHQLAVGNGIYYAESAFTALEREFEGTIGHNAIIEMSRSNS
jgi:hypothetical protein